MQLRFSCLSRLTAISFQFAGAGLASAIAAYLLGQIVGPSPATPPRMQVTETNAEIMRMVRDERALLVELKKELDAQRKPDQAAAPMPVPALKPAKPVQALRRAKPERPLPVEARPRTGDPLPIHSAVVVSQPLPKTVEPSSAVRPIPVSASTDAEGERSSFNMLKRIRAWFQPGNSDAPRPPLPVSKFQQS